MDQGCRNRAGSDASLDERSQMVDRRRFRHEAAQGRIPSIDTGHFVWVSDGPGISLSCARAGPFQHWLLRESIDDQGRVGFIPLLLQHARLRGERRSNDVETLRQQSQIDVRVPVDSVRAEDPRFSRCHSAAQ